MGCDIHLFVEKKVGRSWYSWSRTEVVYGHGCEWVQDYYGYDDRNYALFAVLADVRNRDGLKPLAQPRGLPEDVSWKVQQESESWDGDGHSHSWFTLKELEEYDWGGLRKESGVISAAQYEVLRTTGRPPTEWCQGVSGPGIRVFSEEDYPKLKDTVEHPYVKASWFRDGSVMFGRFVSQTIPRLRELADGNHNDVRIVFWFDN